MTARETLQTFTKDAIPDLHVAVMGALELFEAEPIAAQLPKRFAHPIVIGSGNARAVGEILFADTDAAYADESSYRRVLARHEVIDGAIIVSAGGGKHAKEIARELYSLGIPAVLVTNTKGAAAAAQLAADDVFVFPKNREPYTYNVSTYLGMILAKTAEDPRVIREQIKKVCTADLEEALSKFEAFTFILPKEFGAMAPMIRTKFDELFGPFIIGRVFTEEEIKHAKTVVTSGEECFIALGVKNDYYGAPQNRISLSLPEHANYGMLMALSYYCVGLIQKQQPPYYKKNIDEYVKGISKVFGETINVIVE